MSRPDNLTISVMENTLLQENRDQKPIHWPAVYDEALSLFVEYLRIDTSNPPGNEAPAARWLGVILDALNQV